MGVAVNLSAFEASLAERIRDDALRARLLAEGLPHRRVEAWKWTDLRSAVSKLSDDLRTMTMTASRASDTSMRMEREPILLMPRLAWELNEDSKVYSLVDGETLELDFQAPASTSHRVVTIRVPAGTKANLIERYQVEQDGFANLAIRIVIEEGAQLERVVEQKASAGGVLVVTSGIELSQRAQLKQTTLGFGAKLARLETIVDHAGGEAELNLSGAYVLADGYHLDQTTYVNHRDAHGVTEELFKGAAAKGGKGVFQGKIHVHQPAQKTDAQMQHRGLILQDGGEIYAKPELEIYADDVVCAHGNALGALDESALFYMRQRGIEELRARALLTESFLAEPLDQISDEPLREALTDKLRESLSALS